MNEFFNDLGISGIYAEILIVILLFLISYLVKIIVQKIVFRIISRLSQKTKTEWDDLLLKHKVFSRIFSIGPILVIYLLSPMYPTLTIYLKRITTAFMIFMGLRALDGFIDALNDIYLNSRIKEGKSIKGYLQTIKIIAYLFGIIAIISSIAGKSPSLILSGLGAMTAILMLVFKDTIMSFVASIQISSHNIIKLGDWIESSQFGVDGEVVDLALHLIKIQNWDKTLVTIPTHKLIDSSFKNWRGMQEAGVRRIRRSVLIDISSIKVCNHAMLERFRRIDYLAGYLSQKENELLEYNSAEDFDRNEIVNGRKLTNIGIFRAYIYEYLKRQEHIRQDQPLIVRQLQPDPTGLAIEIYVFADTIEWAEFENIQADLFDHILAIIPEFGLRVYQYDSHYYELIKNK